MNEGFKAPTTSEFFLAKYSVLLTPSNILFLLIAFVLGYVAMSLANKKMPIIIKLLSGLAFSALIFYYLYITSPALYF